MIVVLLIEHFTDAVSQFWISTNLRHNCSLEGPIIDVQLDYNEVSRLAYAANDIQWMRGLLEVICYWSVVEVQPAQSRPRS